MIVQVSAVGCVHVVGALGLSRARMVRVVVLEEDPCPLFACSTALSEVHPSVLLVSGLIESSKSGSKQGWLNQVSPAARTVESAPGHAPMGNACATSPRSRGPGTVESAPGTRPLFSVVEDETRVGGRTIRLRIGDLGGDASNSDELMVLQDTALLRDAVLRQMGLAPMARGRRVGATRGLSWMVLQDMLLRRDEVLRQMEEALLWDALLRVASPSTGNARRSASWMAVTAPAFVAGQSPGIPRNSGFLGFAAEDPGWPPRSGGGLGGLDA